MRETNPALIVHRRVGRPHSTNRVGKKVSHQMLWSAARTVGAKKIFDKRVRLSRAKDYTFFFGIGSPSLANTCFKSLHTAERVS